MRFSPGQVESRREFFRGAARYGLLGLIAVGAAVLGPRRWLSGRCVNRGFCGACALQATCDLPPALRARGGRQGG